MIHHRLIFLFLFLSVSATVTAQVKNSKPAPDKNATAAEEAARKLEAERLLRERRANAESLLINLAVDARNFKDQTLRARTQARIASALWEIDQERSRTMFRSAWESAMIADREAWARMEENMRQQQAKGGGAVAASPPEVRREVLRLAARRDRELGEEMLGKFREQKDAEASAERTKRRNPLGDSDETIRQRLELARQLLSAGDIDRAISFAEPVLNSVSAPTVDFLSYLREKNAVAADERYAHMLANAAANPNSDANTVSLLSSYLFTPHLFIAFVANGTHTTASGPPGELPNVTPDLRMAFFRTASSILLRPPAPADTQSSSSNDGAYLVIKRLLPLFERYATPEMTTSLRAQLDALAVLASKGTRERDDDEWMRRGIGSEKPKDNPEQSLLDRLERAKTAAERDELNLELAMLAADRGDLRARDYVGRIDDMEMRNGARAYVDAFLTLHAVEKKNTEKTLEIMRKAELTHLQRSWALAQIAKLLVKTDRDRALGLIEEATAEARRIQTSERDRPRAFFGVISSLLVLDRKAAWTTADDAIQAANAAEEFTGEDGELTFQLITRNMRAINQTPAPELNVAPVFEAFAEEDFEKAVELARQFQRDAARANAIIAIARTVLEEKKK
jgi:hypothetical protein